MPDLEPDNGDARAVEIDARDSWVSVHAFYDDHLDLLLTGVVAPLIDELAAAGLADESVFLRHWGGGQHLRLRVRPAPGAEPAEVSRLIELRFRDYLSRHPAPERISPPEYAHSAPARPNNSIAFIAYRPEHDRYGLGPSLAAVERHFVESSRIALRIVTGKVPPDHRAAVAIALILIAWFTGEPDPGRLAAWAVRPSTGAAPLPAPDPANLGQAVELARHARQLARNARDLAGPGTLVEWARSLARLRAELAMQVAAGVFAGSAPGRDGGLRTADDGIRSVLDLCAHLVCNRLGLPPVAEAALRDLAAEAVRSLTEQQR